MELCRVRVTHVLRTIGSWGLSLQLGHAMAKASLPSWHRMSLQAALHCSTERWWGELNLSSKWTGVVLKINGFEKKVSYLQSVDIKCYSTSWKATSFHGVRSEVKCKNGFLLRKGICLVFPKWQQSPLSQEILLRKDLWNVAGQHQGLRTINLKCLSPSSSCANCWAIMISSYLLLSVIQLVSCRDHSSMTLIIHN